MPDGHLDAAVQAHATACAAWSGEGRPPRFEDFLVTAPGAPDEGEREETAEESTARILKGFGFPADG